MRTTPAARVLPAAAAALCAAGGALAGGISAEIRQVTSGPRHHFFGYIGHVRTIPWNRSGRYVVALRAAFQERMPGPDDAAEIVLLDTRNGWSARVVDSTRAWNFQQGTMLYWDPLAPETRFFFNDRDPRTQEVFTVLFDISRGSGGERVREYRFPGSPAANSGAAQRGGAFLAINYARLARLRPVTGYPGTRDWTAGVKHPEDDGVFRVDARTGKRRLLVSYRRLADALRPSRPDVDEKELFINHTLWSRDDSRIFFFVRGDFDRREARLDAPFVMDAGGGRLRPLARHIGGHPEWESGRTLIGLRDRDQALFDVERQEVTGTLGTPEIFPVPGGDVALSPDGKWFVNGHGREGRNYYTLLRRADGAWTRTAGVDQGGYVSGELRIDPAPCWNQDGTRLLVPGMAPDGTRQLFEIAVRAAKPR